MSLLLFNSSGRTKSVLSISDRNLVVLLSLSALIPVFASPRGGTLAAADGCDICPNGANFPYAGSQIRIVNNCPHVIDVYTDGGLYGACSWSGSKVPPCLKSLSTGAHASVKLLDAANWGYAFHIALSRSTRFEIAPWKTGTGQGMDSFDISYNAGFDIGMTIQIPAGSKVPRIVATDATAPGVYQLGASGCQVEPCLSPSYTSPQGNYDLYLCNRPGDVNTPGPCGCTACPGIPCTPSASDPQCKTEGSGIYCQVGGSNCPISCGGLPTLSGSPGCPMQCAGNSTGVTGTPITSIV